MRGRSRGKGPNPLTRSYESNGPDVKIRGTAQHIADKYAQLARDATASGDPVAAENYLQHAEHYYRLIAAAQETYRQQFGTQARPFDDEDGDEDGLSGDGFGYGPGERGPQGGAEEFGEMGGGQPYEGRQGGGERGPQGGRFDRGERQDRGGYERQGGGERQDRNGDRGQRFDRNGERFDRNGGYDRNGPRGQGGGERFDRNGGGYGQNGERFDRPDRPEGQDRRERFGRGESREGGRDGGRRDFNRDRNRPEGGGRFPGGQPEERDAPGGGGLPAFLTTPVRSTIALDEEDRGAAAEAMPVFEADAQAEAGLNGIPEARPRRTRRPRRTEASESLDLGGAEADKPAE